MEHSLFNTTGISLAAGSLGALIAWVSQHRSHQSEMEKLFKQSSELAHDCETLLLLVQRVSETSSQADRSGTLLRDIEKYIKKWRAISSGKLIAASTEPELISWLVRESLERVQSSESYQGISFQVEVKSLSFSRVNSHEFSGSIRNLLRNSAQSLSSRPQGLIQVSVEDSKDQVLIKIQDNGPGIPPEIQPKIFQRGTTYGKKGGSGLGLSTTKARLESWGGAIQLIHSSPEKGTLFQLALPKIPAPAWYLEKLSLDPGSVLVQVDHDPTLLPVIESKFSNLFQEVDLHFFTSIEGCEGYLKKNPESKKFFVVDHQLKPGSLDGKRVKSGFDFIRHLQLENQAIVLTDLWNHPKIQSEARELRVKLLPRPFLQETPVELREPSQGSKVVSAVLIDDQEIFRQDWQDAAANRGLSIVTCTSVTEFLDRYRHLPKHIPIYIDEFLDGGLKGQEESLAIAALGFHNLHLTTFDAMAAQDLAQYPHLKSVRGKTPKF